MLDISYRVRNLIIAGALAICAVALMLVYVSHAKKHSSSVSTKSVPVYVATRDIPIGTTGQTLASGNWMQLRNLPSDSVASGVVATPAQLRTFVAIQPTYAGEQIVARRFGTIQQEGLLSDLKGAARVIELPGDAHQLLAGTLKQGNRVDVIGNLPVPEGGQNHDTVVALRNLLVVKAPSNPSSSAADQTLSVDLQLSGAQAERLFWLQRNGNWALMLRPSNHASDTTLTPATAATVVEGSNGR
jgi:Flp pilus assembly protein CpaB